MSDSQGERPDYDQTLKRLLVRAHDGFLGLVAPELTWRRELSPELPAESRQADLVWEVASPDGRQGILHVELQTKIDREIGERLADYALRLWLRQHLPVRTVVIYLRPATTVPASPFVIDGLGAEALRFTYGVIRLWELSPERVLATDLYDLWPLAGIMGEVTPDSTVALTERLATAPVPSTDRAELTRLLFSLLGLRLTRQQAARAIRRSLMSKNLFEDSTFPAALQDVMAEIPVRNTIHKVLEARFGPLDQEMIVALALLDGEALDALVAPSATESLEQIRVRLGLGEHA
jgi:hypothetical protein